MQRQPIRRGYGARSALLLSESAGETAARPHWGVCKAFKHQPQLVHKVLLGFRNRTRQRTGAHR